MKMNKIKKLIRDYDKEKDALNKIGILVETRKGIDRLQKELAKKVR
jgi:hypothetical protein